ncbi:MAG: hypothetical protein GY821_07135 [Gammaproteobacteria bacterium]|nr:hypothetical protein [Gammaproteobacteria bacterium]MCP4474328.1 hypothetical protein [Gammaproteobacteria bacterium]
MIAKWFGELILRRRMNAILVALLCSLLPLTNWLAMVTVVVVTLAKSPAEGLLVLMWALLPAIVLGISGHYWFLVVVEVFGNGLLLWVLAIAYKRTHRWEYIISLAIIIGLVFVLLLHLFVADPSAWMMRHLNSIMHREGMEVNEQRLLALALIKPFIVGVNISFALLIALLELIIGAAVCSIVKKGRPLGSGLRNIRLHYGSVFILALFIVLALIGPQLFCSLLIIVMLPFFIAGISLIHGIVVQKQLSPFLLFAIYMVFFMLLMIFPPFLGLVVLLAVLDSFANFRRMKWFN